MCGRPPAQLTGPSILSAKIYLQGADRGPALAPQETTLGCEIEEVTSCDETG